MDTQKLVSDRVETLLERVSSREYRGRKMVVSVDTHSEDMKSFTVKGNLVLSVSETPEEKESWIDKSFDVMIVNDDADMAVAEVFAHLNSIPMEYGDTIFEDDFDEVIKLMEATDGETEISQEETTLQ
jgi:hypothetical protein